MIPLRKVAYLKLALVTTSKWVRWRPSSTAEREVLKSSYSTMMSLHHPRGERSVRTRIVRSTGTYCIIGVKLLCTLNFEAECYDLVIEQSFKSVITREKYRTATFQVSIIPRSADLEFVVHYHGEELARVQADYAENLRDTVVGSKEFSVT